MSPGSNAILAGPSERNSSHSVAICPEPLAVGEQFRELLEDFADA